MSFERLEQASGALVRVQSNARLWADVEMAASMVRENPDYIVGIKARLSREVAGEQDVDALKRALEAAEAAAAACVSTPMAPSPAPVAAATSAKLHSCPGAAAAGGTR